MVGVHIRKSATVLSPFSSLPFHIILQEDIVMQKFSCAFTFRIRAALRAIRHRVIKKKGTYSSD